MSYQLSLFDAVGARSLLDRLITESRLYKTSRDYKELLDFVIRLRPFAPFNAMRKTQAIIDLVSNASKEPND